MLVYPLVFVISFMFFEKLPWGWGSEGRRLYEQSQRGCWSWEDSMEIMEKLPVYAPNRCTKDMPFGFWLLASLSPAHTLLSYPRLLASHLGDMWPE